MEVGQLSELGARVAAMVLGALLPIRMKAGDTIRVCHGAGGGALWHVRTAVRRPRVGHKRGPTQIRGRDRKVGIKYRRTLAMLTDAYLSNAQ